MRFLPGPLGPGCAKFVLGAVFALRLGFLSQRSRCKIAFPLQGGRWLAVGQTDRVLSWTAIRIPTGGRKGRPYKAEERVQNRKIRAAHVPPTESRKRLRSAVSLSRT